MWASCFSACAWPLLCEPCPLGPAFPFPDRAGVWHCWFPCGPLPWGRPEPARGGAWAQGLGRGPAPRCHLRSPGFSVRSQGSGPARTGPLPTCRVASDGRGRWSDRSARGCDLSPQSRCRAFSTRRCVTSWRNSATGAPASQPRAWGVEHGHSRTAEESRPGVGKNM